jgi:hypothetical protein
MINHLSSDSAKQHAYKLYSLLAPPLQEITALGLLASHSTQSAHHYCSSDYSVYVQLSNTNGSGVSMWRATFSKASISCLRSICCMYILVSTCSCVV